MIITNRLQNKNVVITGASSGIGMECAHAFAKFGANLILVARRLDRLTVLKKELETTYKCQVQIEQADLSIDNEIYSFFSKLKTIYSNIDILVNNAGLSKGLEHTVDGEVDNWHTMIDINVKGLIITTQQVLKVMYPQKSGHIINIGSTAGIFNYANASVYCATKSAVHAFSRSLREECIEHGIKVSEVMPGMVGDTEFSNVRFNGDVEKAKNVYRGVEYLTPSDVAELVVYTANLPAHVNLAESVLMPKAQANSHKIYRGE